MAFIYTPQGELRTGTEGNDSLNGTAGDDTVNGLAGNDYLYGFPSTNTPSQDGNDILDGGEGSDSLYGGTGSDTLNGGAGSSDTISYQGNNSAIHHVTLNLVMNPTTKSVSRALIEYDSNGQLLGVDSFSGVERFFLTTGSDTVLSSDPSFLGVYILGFGGSDHFFQQAYATSGFGADAFIIGRASGLNVGYSWVSPQTGTNKGISAVWSQGVGTVRYFDSANGQLAGTDTLYNVQNLNDSRFDDLIDMRGFTTGPLGLPTRVFNDFKSLNSVVLYGGNDTVYGNGSTFLMLGPWSGTWVQPVDSSSARGVTIDLKTGVADLSVLQGYGTLTFSGIEGVFATKLNDLLIGGQPDHDSFEHFRGEGGNDTIQGGTGYDRANYESATAGVTINLSAGIVTGDASVGTDTLIGVESIRASDHADIFDARGFSATVGDNRGDKTPSNDVSPGGGLDLIYGNGYTRVDYYNALLPVKADLASGGDALYEADKSSSNYWTVGTDTYVGGIQGLNGSMFSDWLLGTANGDGNLSAEFFLGSGGHDTIDGGLGWDYIVYNNSPGAIDVDLRKSSNQVLDGWGYTDSVFGIEGVDGSYYADNLRGSDSVTQREVFSGRRGDDTIDGGSGLDKVFYYYDIKGVVVWLGASQRGVAPTEALVDQVKPGFEGVALDSWGDIDQLVNLEGVEGSMYNDLLVGDHKSNRLDGRGGNDTLDGGLGFDWAEYNNSGSAVNVNLSTGTAAVDGTGGSDLLLDIEAVLGSLFNDQLTGSLTANQLDGMDGHDSLQGLAGDDTLSGGSGNDTLEGGLGDDVMAGGAGDDSLSSGSGMDYLTGGEGADVLELSAAGTWSNSYKAQNEFLTGANVQNQNYRLLPLVGMNRFAAVTDGGDGFDTLKLTALADAIAMDDVFSPVNSQASLASGRMISIEFIDAGDGNDLIDLTTTRAGSQGYKVWGGAGHDTLWGGQGADTLEGNAGNDVLLGAAGNDNLSGNEGADVFVFAPGSGQDTIKDFANGDKVVLLGLGNNSATVSYLNGNTVLSWGNSAVTLTGVQLSSDNSTSWYESIS